MERILTRARWEGQGWRNETTCIGFEDPHTAAATENVSCHDLARRFFHLSVLMIIGVPMVISCGIV